VNDDVDTARRTALLGTASRDGALYDACRAYAQHYDDGGDGDADPETNGALEILRAAIPGRQRVFDVGAHRGDWIAAVLAINPALEVHAFEPDPRSVAELRARRFPASASVAINALGLGAEIGRSDLWTYGDATEISSLYRRQTLSGLPAAAPTSAGPVELTTLGAYCRSRAITRINYLKIDTEGHDLKVLRGGHGLLSAGAVDLVQFEYGATNIDSRDLLMDFFAFFEDLPYALHKIHPEWIARHECYDQRLENFAYQNWIAVRRLPAAAP
jgi:FkbM family methyltransferase